jgi:hypothetical protein
MPFDPSKPPPSGTRRRKLQVEDVAKIKLALSNGWSCYRLGKLFGVSAPTIAAIKRGWTYQEVQPATPESASRGKTTTS